mgnify:CR=1 FL=1
MKKDTVLAEAINPFFLAPAFGLPLALGAALLFSAGLSVEHKEQELTVCEEEPASFAYVPILRYIDIPVPGDRGRLRAEVDASLNTKDLETLQARFADGLNSVTMSLVEKALQLAEQLLLEGKLDTELRELRTALPAVLRDELNHALGRAGLPPIVNEILVSDWDYLPPVQTNIDRSDSVKE